MKFIDLSFGYGNILEFVQLKIVDLHALFYFPHVSLKLYLDCAKLRLLNINASNIFIKKFMYWDNVLYKSIVPAIIQ